MADMQFTITFRKQFLYEKRVRETEQRPHIAIKILVNSRRASRMPDIYCTITCLSKRKMTLDMPETSISKPGLWNNHS